MLAGFFQGIVQDRKLMREAQVNLAIRWFVGYRLQEKLPDHSSLTRIRQRWGAERFKRIFQRTVQACCKAGLVNGETLHIDATLIRADVSWESLTTRHVEQVLEVNGEDGSPDNPTHRRRGRPRTKPKHPKKYSPTDPDATMSTSCKQYRMEPCYKQHAAVDDQAGVIVDVAVTTGESSEGKQLLDQIDRAEANIGCKVKTVTADGGYAHSTNYAQLEDRDIDAVIPPQTETRRPRNIPVRRFRYDAKHKRVRCPGGKTLLSRGAMGNGTTYRARSCDCKACPLRARCFSQSASVRTILIVDGYEALVRMRRRKARGWSEHRRRAYRRHRWRVEGVHGEAKTQHRLSRAARRGLVNVVIQSYLTAAVMNLKRLAALLLGVTSMGIAGFRRDSAEKACRNCSVRIQSRNIGNLKTAA
jgi:IS5 family transposase